MDHTMLDKLVPGIPFTFRCGGADSMDLLRGWPCRRETAEPADGRIVETAAWADPALGLRVVCTATRFEDFPAVEWLARFHNDGPADTPILSEMHAMDLRLAPALDDGTFVLHRVSGAPANATDNEPRTETLRPGDAAMLSGGGGRSSNKDLPFFRVDARDATLIVAVGWSGQWQAALRCAETADGPALAMTAGLEDAHFRLHPGESVRGPRMLVLAHEGEREEAHAAFRALMLRHYAARAHGPDAISRQPIAEGPGAGRVEPQPVLFCNTCFTRKGAWLNECNEENQIALTRALAPLGVQVVLTDAGWFLGGWPRGAGNWDADPEKYPRGMGPVAQAARACGMTYGLWFEPERVVPGTPIDRDHAQWVLRCPGLEEGLLNFGKPEVQAFFFDIVEQYLRLPGMDAYRQDFNRDPLPYWRAADAPDRRGICEMKYIEGLYAYWDALRAAHPDLFMEECASGGRRTDLETIMRFQAHQKSDYWFDAVVDQASLFALSAYLPNVTISVPIDRLDDYAFHSALASSLITGWIADGPGFDTDRAAHLTRVYRSVRHLLNGAWYGLTPWSRDADRWLVSQYHRGDLGEGMVLAFRREACAGRQSVRLRALDPAARYAIRSAVTGGVREATGEELMAGLDIAISNAPGSDLLVYQAV